MRVLISCVNSVVSFVGFDLATEQAFWYCPADRVRACGASYQPDFDGAGNTALLAATDNTLSRYSAARGVERVALPGPHPNLAHSVHSIEGQGLGVVDTGNSRLLVYGNDLAAHVAYEPLEGWGPLPSDAIHLNDFTRTPEGLVASCFNFQPYRSVEVKGYHWQSHGYGLILSMEKRRGRFVGRVVGAGLSCPHSLVWHEDRLWCCSSAVGEFIRLRYQDNGILAEEERMPITRDYFLRGALPLAAHAGGGWLLGGSSIRDARGKGMALLHREPGGTVREMPIAPAGEIYDILPWDDAVMQGVADMMNSLPPVFAEEGNAYPPPCRLEG